MRSNNIGKTIEQLRKKKGITQAVLGKAVGVKRETINQWESNTRDLKTKATIKLAEYFHVSCDYILRGIDAEFTDVHAATGLSNDAINELNAYADSGISQLLEIILNSGRMPELVGNLSDYLTYREELEKRGSSTITDFVQIETASDHKTRLKESVKENRVTLSAYDAREYCFQRTLNILNNIIEEEL